MPYLSLINSFKAVKELKSLQATRQNHLFTFIHHQTWERRGVALFVPWVWLLNECSTSYCQCLIEIKCRKNQHCKSRNYFLPILGCQALISAPFLALVQWSLESALVKSQSHYWLQQLPTQTIKNSKIIVYTSDKIHVKTILLSLLLSCVFMSRIASASGNVISWVQLLQPTHQLGLWAAADNMWHRLAFDTREHIGCCKVPSFNIMHSGLGWSGSNLI